ncbi:MAG TPA: hypothetical protein VK817_08875 [Trebonia sp.]|nr:hypothetical protein [Trebonia sp.]
MRVALAACPRRARVPAAKVIVLGTVTFAAGLAGAVIAVPVGERLAWASGVYLFPVTFPVLVRVEAGTAAPRRSPSSSRPSCCRTFWSPRSRSRPPACRTG